MNANSQLRPTIDEGALDPIPRLTYRDPVSAMDAPPPLYDGDAEIAWPAGYESLGRITFVQDLPLPAHILAVMPQLIAADR